MFHFQGATKLDVAFCFSDRILLASMKILTFDFLRNLPFNEKYKFAPLWIKIIATNMKPSSAWSAGNLPL